ncbi:MAG: T9SS type A sorting domain-containing protein [Bacteroidetes bacterium]|nr:T9SS type A sorting domain-containing protein [Bacteroidota bacterium]
MKTAALFIPAIFIFPAYSFAQNSGVHDPGTTENNPYLYCTTCAGSIWNDAANVNETDNDYSTLQLAPYLNCFQSTCYWSRYLSCYNFNFSIPQNAVIEGIEMDMNGFSSLSSAVLDCTIVIRRNANSVAGTNMASLISWSTSDETRHYGGNGELWGYNWTPAEINAPDFGVNIKLYNPTTFSPSVSVDHVSMTVTYEVSTGIYSQTSSPHPLRVNVNTAQQTMNMSFDIPDESNAVHFYVYDMNGAEVFASVAEGVNGGTYTEKVNTENLSPGMYICTVVDGDKIYSEKTIIGN